MAWRAATVMENGPVSSPRSGTATYLTSRRISRVPLQMAAAAHGSRRSGAQRRIASTRFLPSSHPSRSRASGHRAPEAPKVGCAQASAAARRGARSGARDLDHPPDPRSQRPGSAQEAAPQHGSALAPAIRGRSSQRALDRGLQRPVPLEGRQPLLSTHRPGRLQPLPAGLPSAPGPSPSSPCPASAGSFRPTGCRTASAPTTVSPSRRMSRWAASASLSVVGSARHPPRVHSTRKAAAERSTRTNAPNAQARGYLPSAHPSPRSTARLQRLSAGLTKRGPTRPWVSSAQLLSTGPSSRLLRTPQPITYPTHFEVRWVSQLGNIRWKKQFVFVSRMFKYEPIGLEQLSPGLWVFSTALTLSDGWMRKTAVSWTEGESGNAAHSPNCKPSGSNPG